MWFFITPVSILRDPFLPRGKLRSSEGRWHSQSRRGSERKPGLELSVPVFPVQVALTPAAPVRPEYLRAAGPPWTLGPGWLDSARGGGHAGCPTRIIVCPCFSSQDGERRYREASARRKIRLDRRVGAGLWEGTLGPGLSTHSPGLRDLHFFDAAPVLGPGWALHLHVASFRSCLTGPLYSEDTDNRESVATGTHIGMISRAGI